MQAVASLGLALYYCWKLTLVILATIPFTAVGLAIISAGLPLSLLGQEEQMSKALKTATFALSNIMTVKCANTQDQERRKFCSALQISAQFYVKQARINALQIGFIRFATTSMFVQGFWLGSHLVNTGGASAGSVITTFWSCLMATKAFEDILPYVLVLEKGRAAGASLEAILDTVQKDKRVPDETRSLEVPVYCEGDVDMKHITFAYPARPDRPVLKEATLFFPAGEVTFVVGESGSGKSSVANLLMQFYHPQQGTIMIDGRSLKELDFTWLRNNVTFIQQKSILFNETIFQNVALGHQAHEVVTLNDVRPCIELANLQTTIQELTEGLDTRVGTGGAALSGGQKQRIAIARGRLRDTPVLILDESTSALDHVNRTAVLKKIRAWRQKKTTIIITHDLASIENDDFVYILREGQIIAEGYRRDILTDLEKEDKTTLLTPAISPSPHFDFDFDFAHERTKGADYDEWLPQNVDLNAQGRRNSIDEHIDLYYRPPPPVILRQPSLRSRLGRALTHRTPRHLPIPPISMNNYIEQPGDLMPPLIASKLQVPNLPTRAFSLRTSRPMSLHQATTLRALERSQSTGQKQLPRPQLQRSKISASQPNETQSKIQEEETVHRNLLRISAQAVLKTVWPRLSTKYRMIMLSGFLAALVHAAGPPVFSYVLVQLFQTFYVVENHSTKAVIYSLVILAIAVIDGIANFCMHYFLEISAQKWVDGLRAEAMRRLLDQEKAFFDDLQNSVGYLTQCLDRSAEEMRNLVGRFLGLIVVVVAMMAMAIIWSLVTCWELTLLGIAAGPFLYAMTKSFETVSARWEARTNESDDRVSSTFVETFSDIRTVRAFTIEPYFQKKYTSATSAAMGVGIKRAIFCGFFFGMSDSAVNFLTALIFWFGAYLAKERSFGVKEILTAFSLLLFSTANANAVLAYIPQISSSIEIAGRLIGLASMPQHSHELSGHLKLESHDPSTLNVPVHFINLTFSYPSRPEMPALRRLNLTILPGLCTALVGASGSGKSTITSLILGLYPPTADSSARSASDDHKDGPPSLTLSGRDIRSLHLPTLRGLLAIVPQDPVLLPGTVRENIIYGLSLNSDLTTDANIIAAARRAGIHDFVLSLPDGYDTVIGEGGLGMSGGQAQRVAIARALVRKPRILILDEPTSALDRDNAELVKQSILALLAETRWASSTGKSGPTLTVIIVTHAREMMESCDHVVMMEQGSVAEEGTFRELMRRKGPLWAMMTAEQTGIVEE